MIASEVDLLSRTQAEYYERIVSTGQKLISTRSALRVVSLYSSKRRSLADASIESSLDWKRKNREGIKEVLHDIDIADTGRRYSVDVIPS